MRPIQRRRLLSGVAGAACALIAVSTYPVFADSEGGEQPQTRPADCVVDEKLVNSCRPWLGARAAGYPEADSGLAAQHEYHEERVGRRIDIAHTFAPPGSLPLEDPDEVALAGRADTYLFQNWKPASHWADAGGGDAEIDARIDAAAENVAAVSPAKIFLTLHHEPENDVTSDPDCDTKDSASAGTAEEYVQMWRNVRSRFEAKGVDNVVWVMDYMNYDRWDCLVPKVYPGDSYVDWVMFNAYGRGGNSDFEANVARFAELLTDLSRPDRDFTSKPWGIVEWGIQDSTQEEAIDYYRQAAAVLDADVFPELKAYMIFDSPGTHDQGGLRVGYDDEGNLDPAEQSAYTEFANHPAFSDPIPAN